MHLIYQMHRHAPREFKDYPKELILKGKLDPDIQFLTKDARKDEEIIADQRKELLELTRSQIVLLKQNISLTNYVMIKQGFLPKEADLLKLVDLDVMDVNALIAFTAEIKSELSQKW